ncbi:MAG: glycoside hydrolase family 19 protein [Dysgonomonas sp.]|nr:glycoside hydrolase family 19 protein [Dysgonomonas sp.]
MMTLTDLELKWILPASTQSNRNKYLPWINYFAPSYQIDNIARLSAFLAQTGHESVQLLYVEEIASGKAYEGREDLGNIYVGDGVKYKGRGIIQITGRSNYTDLSKEFRIDFVNHPELLTQPQYAVWSAFWFWEKYNLNRYATLKEEDFRKMTKIINGGYNGYADRVNIWNRAKDVLSKK